MCRLERSVCRPGPLGGFAGAACLWIADREVKPGLQEPWTGYRYSDEGTALSRGSLPARAWMGACGPSRRPESSFGRTTRKSSIERRNRVAGPQFFVRFMGDELDGLQLR